MVETMKRILMCSQQFSAGGISRVVHSLREALIRNGYSVEVMAPSYPACEEADIPIPSLNMPGLIGSLSFWELATRMAERRKDHYDLIMMHHPVLLSGKSFNLSNNAIFTFHGTYYGYAQAYHLYKLGFYGPYYDLATMIERRLLNKLSDNQRSRIVVTGVSPSTISELRANGYADVAHFVPNAMPNIGEIISKKRARNRLSRSTYLRFDDDDRVLLSVGRIDPQKQPLLIPSLFSEIVKGNSDVKLVIVGEGSLSHRLQKLLKAYNNAFYLGFVPQEWLHLIYSCADAYISLSCCEGLPNCVLEAAAHGLPLILSEILAHRWIISERIGHGILVDSFNPKKDADKASALLESSSDVPYYPDYNATKLSWDKIAETYLRLGEV